MTWAVIWVDGNRIKRVPVESSPTAILCISQEYVGRDIKVVPFSLIEGGK